MVDVFWESGMFFVVRQRAVIQVSIFIDLSGLFVLVIWGWIFVSVRFAMVIPVSLLIFFGPVCLSPCCLKVLCCFSLLIWFLDFGSSDFQGESATILSIRVGRRVAPASFFSDWMISVTSSVFGGCMTVSRSGL